MTPVIGIVCFAIILVELVRRRALLRGHPGRPGRHRRRHAHRLGLDRVRPQLRRHERSRSSAASFANFGFSRPAAGLRPRLRRASSSSASSWSPRFRSASTTSSRRSTTSRAPPSAGDSFPTTRVLTADGVVSLIGCLMGNPFINAVYIGHPGWKAMGGRIGYSAATGVMVHRALPGSASSR